MKDTRQLILNTARVLFNEKGFNSVSLREIADSIGISKGNLTYYFNKKEDIIEALIAEAKDTRITETPDSLVALDDYFTDMQQVVQNNSFYFAHHTQLSQVSDVIRQKQHDVSTEKSDILKNALIQLHKEGYIRKELFDGEYEYLSDALHMGSIYWKSYQKLKETDKEKCYSFSYRKYAWGILYHLLTVNGRDELKSIITL